MISETILIIILLLILIIYYYKLNYYKVVYQKADLDSKMYLVRDVHDKDKSANMLAKIRENILEINKHMIQNVSNYKDMEPYIKQLNDKIKDKEIVIQEGADDGIYTSYSVNKGEELVFCLRSRDPKKKDKLHDINLLMYVVLHEISHIACPEFGHTELFKKIFAFITTKAIELGIYKKINFRENNMEYCGMMITDSII